MSDHRMIPGSHERPTGPECRCGAEWSRWEDRCAATDTDAAVAAKALREAADQMVIDRDGQGDDVADHLVGVREWLDARADRIEREGGDDAQR